MSDVNVFLIVNLGCEMLYVIDQRLAAQCITSDKTIQVLRDITSVLLDTKFIQRLILGSQQKAILTSEHCKFILNDIACCSLMRLDESSMSKLWDLITMVFKWQLEMTEMPHHIMEVTFRHLDGVAQLYPAARKTMLIDHTKNILIDFWNTRSEESQLEIFTSLKNWFQPLAMKISILIRLGFQNLDGQFIPKDSNSSHLALFIENIGENIYNKATETAAKNAEKSGKLSCNQFEALANQLTVDKTNDDIVMQQRVNIEFGDFNSTQVNDDEPDQSEFVRLETIHNATNAWGNALGGDKYSMVGKDLKTLLNTKLL